MFVTVVFLITGPFYNVNILVCLPLVLLSLWPVLVSLFVCLFAGLLICYIIFKLIFFMILHTVFPDCPFLIQIFWLLEQFCYLPRLYCSYFCNLLPAQSVLFLFLQSVACPDCTVPISAICWLPRLYCSYFCNLLLPHSVLYIFIWRILSYWKMWYHILQYILKCPPKCILSYSRRSHSS
jgi:hypothetical protein